MSEIIWKDIFNKYDTDHSGFIDRPELQACLKSTFQTMNIQVTPEMLDWHVKRFDENEDGKISLQEYCKKMQQFNTNKK